MQGVGIFSGDILVVDRARESVRGNIIIAVFNNEPICKRLDFCGSNPVSCSENPKYPPRYIMEGDEFSSWKLLSVACGTMIKRRWLMGSIQGCAPGRQVLDICAMN